MSHMQAIPMTAQHIPFLHGLFMDPANQEALHARDFALADWQGAFAASQTDSDEELFILMQGDKPAAWLKINGLDSDTAWIAMLVVDSRHHREGVGSFAVRYAEDYTIGRGFTQMGIHTTEDNIAAQGCYRKAGYKITDSGECHGSDGVKRNGYTLMKSFWFHGSPLVLDELRSGSTITQWKALAEAFSHKPSRLEYDHVGGKIKHNGSQPGFLYLINEPIAEGVDIHKHANSSMDDGVEWLTDRPLEMRLLTATEMSAKKAIKMIVTDLDRTLLRTDKTISDYTFDVLTRCREHGILIVFATARSWRGIQDYVQKFTIDALIAVNGALIYQGATKILEYFIPEQAKHDVLRELSESGVTKVAAATENYKYSNHHAPSYDIVCWDFAEKVPEPIYRISTHHDVPECVISIIQRHDDLRLYTVYGEDLFDIESAQAGKWNAVRFLSEYFAISIAEIAAFGDDSNDIEMLNNAGLGIAVENAIPEAKSAADFVCEDHDSDGVARWLEANVL